MEKSKRLYLVSYKDTKFFSCLFPFRVNLPVNKPRKKIAWIVSHCDAASKRMQFVQRLKKYVNVDIYGQCGTNLQGICKWKWTNQNDTGKNNPYCLHEIVKKYKFYLAFENSLCEDYISEKAAQFMNIASVPIIMSNAKVEQYLPKNSYINIFDFKTIQDLANHILYLDDNFDEYFKYFTWRTKWTVDTQLVTRPRVKCDMCDLLHTNHRKTYHNLADWFAGPHVCDNGRLKRHFSDFQP